jgi:hypothetical protein
MMFPKWTRRIPFTQKTISWYGWRTFIGERFPFEAWVPWCIKGPVWNWCWKVDFDWRKARADERLAIWAGKR